MAACTQARCWRISPGLGRPARMRVMCRGRPVTMDSARPVRRIWPPPSPVEPSRSICCTSRLFFFCLDTSEHFQKQRLVSMQRVPRVFHLHSYDLERLNVLYGLMLSKTVAEHYPGFVFLHGNSPIDSRDTRFGKFELMLHIGGG